MAIKLRVLEIMKERGYTSAYQVYKPLGMSWQNFDRIVNQKSQGIRFETINKLCNVLKVTPQDLFVIVPEDSPK